VSGPDKIASITLPPAEGLRMMFPLRICLVLAIAWIIWLPAEASDPLSVVTYNIRYANPGDGLDVWPNRIDAVSNFIAQHDVIGLQEVTFAQLDDLKERLKEFDYYGVGRDDGQQGGEHAPIFYRRDRIEAIEQGTIWLSEHPEQVGVKGWDAALPRTCTWMVLQDKTSKRKFWIANTHFDHKGARARAESGKLIHQLATEKSQGLPTVVMGDFNCLPGSDPYQALTADKSLADARLISQAKATGPSSTWNGFQEIEANQIIDHLFVGGPLEVLRFETLNPKTAADRFASDHLPVRAMIQLQSQAVEP
jgi:endonuclease/exonuclease/phosphatase family metal-dependent hydrolase